MKLRNLSLQSPHDNVYFDEVLFDQVEAGCREDVLRVWESPVSFIVLGKACQAQDDVHLKQARRDGIPILRRCSGGGTILQGKGCLNFTLVLLKKNFPQIATIPASYHFILEKIQRGLGAMNIQTCVFPPCDLALQENDRKFSGHAQRRGKRAILHHGTLLYDFDIACVRKYLKMPAKMPAYRRQRDHDLFMTNISCSSAQCIGMLSSVFEAEPVESHLSCDEEQLLAAATAQRTAVF